MAAVHNQNAQQLLREVGQRAHRVPHGVVIAVDLVVAGQVAAVSRDVVARHVACAVKLAHAAYLFVCHFSAARKHVIGHIVYIKVFTNYIAVACVIKVDKEPRIRQAHLIHHAARKARALEAQSICRLKALTLAPAVAREGVVNRQRSPKTVLPVEVPAVKVAATAHENLGLGRPAAHRGQAVWLDRHVVVHDPKPIGAQVIGNAHARRKAAGPAGVLGHGMIDHTVHAALGIWIVGRLAPALPHPGREIPQHRSRFWRVLVVHHHDAPRGLVQPQDRIQQPGEQVLPLEGHYDDRGPLHEHPLVAFAALL